MIETAAKPTPTVTDLSRPYWEGVNAGELRLQSCGACGSPRHYPRLLCDRCYSDEIKWITASGRGRIHSWTVAHHPYHPAFVTEVPYTIVLVDLDEGPRALGRWFDVTPTIGQLVNGRFVARDGGADLVFAPF